MLGRKTDSLAAHMLAKAPIFSTLSDRQRRRLSREGVEKVYKSGDTVVAQGQGGLGFYLILDGAVEVRKGRRVLAKLGPGQFFGEMSLLDDQPRSADVVAAEPTRCLVLSKWEFWGFASSQPSVLRGVLREMARRLRETDRALSE
jgi:CRP/FNR family cyclic AMP-dependent transcriptional regulator